MKLSISILMKDSQVGQVEGLFSLHVMSFFLNLYTAMAMGLSVIHVQPWMLMTEL